MTSATQRDIETPHGTARAHVHRLDGSRAALVLGHGAGGGIGAGDLVAAATAAVDVGLTAVLVEQPYRVAGRRSPAPAGQLDTAWTSVVEQLRETELSSLALVVGGRSSGARVACRTATALGAAGVLCLAFPLVPPARRGGTPAQSRLPELEAVKVPTLVVQGTGDRFGMPPPGTERTIVQVRGDHGLRTDLATVQDAIRGWLRGLVG